MQDSTWGLIAWEGLLAYILLTDSALGLAGKPYMTDIFRDALRHPAKRWLVISAWALTTKHLFYPELLPWLDPFSVIGLGVFTLKKAIS
jgi:hypothetical protein